MDPNVVKRTKFQRLDVKVPEGMDVVSAPIQSTESRDVERDSEEMPGDANRPADVASTPTESRAREDSSESDEHQTADVGSTPTVVQKLHDQKRSRSPMRISDDMIRSRTGNTGRGRENSEHVIKESKSLFSEFDVAMLSFFADGRIPSLPVTKSVVSKN